jgi:hypothetical protein
MSQSLLNETNEEALISRINKLEQIIEEMKANQPPSDIVGSTVTGGIIRTALTGKRIALNDGFMGTSNNLIVYDENHERIIVDEGGISFIDEEGNDAGFISGQYVQNGIEFYPTIVVDGDFKVNGWSEFEVVYVSDLYALGDIFADGDLECEDIKAFGNLEVVGSKDFNIPHPTKEGKRLVYSCIESPEVLVMCRGKKGDKIPQHFYDVSEPDTLDIITGVDGNWLATAVRKGYLDREIEPDDTKDSNPQNPEHQERASGFYSRRADSQAVSAEIKSKSKPVEQIDK